MSEHLNKKEIEELFKRKSKTPIISIILGIIIVIFLMVLLLQFSWNMSIAKMFGVTITYWQSFWLLILSSMIFNRINFKNK